MPGNEKRTGSQAPDPDPAPYLYLTFEMKRNDMAKPYDAKRWGSRTLSTATEHAGKMPPVTGL